MKQATWLDNHVKEILHYQAMIDKLGEDEELERIELLSKMLVFIGKVAGQISEDYKLIYAKRKLVHSEIKLEALNNKEARAEIGIAELRKEEAKAYGDYKRWNNAFISTHEEINVLKYKIKISIEDGSNKQGA